MQKKLLKVEERTFCSGARERGAFLVGYSPEKSLHAARCADANRVWHLNKLLKCLWEWNADGRRDRDTVHICGLGLCRFQFQKNRNLIP